MDIQLTWDLFILVFFVVIVAYSLIIGQNNTLKVILGTYVAMIAADATGSLFAKYFAGSPAFNKILSFAQIGTEEEAIIFVKVLVFVGLVILFAVRGAFEVDAVEDRSAIVRMILTGVYACMSAGLIISTILTFVSGVSFVGGGSPETTSTALWDIYNSSKIVRSIVGNSYLWFSVPAVAFLIQSLYSHRKTD
mgnify:CR=1 FL=1|jgi:hypothetical protein